LAKNLLTGGVTDLGAGDFGQLHGIVADWCVGTKENAVSA
jgi:hypothetical protein